jgi:hypothetical protein
VRAMRRLLQRRSASSGTAWRILPHAHRAVQ